MKKTRERELAQAKEIEKAHAELQQTHTHLKSTQQQLIQQEKLASLGKLTSGIAHEIKNPLNFVNNFARLNRELVEELREGIQSSEEMNEVLSDLHQNTQQIVKHGERADQIVRSMMEHASESTGKRYEVSINDLVEELTDLSYHSFTTRNPNITVQINKDFSSETGSLNLAPQDIGRVLQNILNNAFDAVCEKKRKSSNAYLPTVTIRTERKNDQVRILIEDNGCGIPDGIKKKIFEPFFTTKPTGSGTGLGLSLSYDIVTQGHGGSLSVESEEGEGAVFVIRLPA